ncbi:MAG: acetolactate decarboxylase [Actinomycetota bacterium]|nr:acetolactate decarboxylase [Actinomycetota bacterium]
MTGVIWQNAPAIALESGCYDGLTPISELRQHGDLGIGAFDQLDGELVAVDGVFYQVTGDAAAHVPDDSVTLPFCQVTMFGGKESHNLPSEVTADTLLDLADGWMGTQNLYYSYRIDGSFRSLALRCLPKQSKPFPPLAEVAKDLPRFSYDVAEGTMVGFRAPVYVGNLSPPGFHLHFISADRRFGGHVLSFEGADATITLELVERQEILFPNSADFATKELMVDHDAAGHH